jgi:inhibitor of KinA
MSMKIMPAGDEAVVAEFGDKIDDGINRKVHVLARRIDREKIRGIKELLPTYRSLMVLYDPRIISYAALCRKIGKLEPADTDEGEGTRRTIIVPCCYEGAFAPDMPDMQKATGLHYEEIVRLHSGVDYKIYMLGFLPGFVYLGGLDPPYRRAPSDDAAHQHTGAERRHRRQPDRRLSDRVARRLEAHRFHTAGVL